MFARGRRAAGSLGKSPKKKRKCSGAAAARRKVPRHTKFIRKLSQFKYPRCFNQATLHVAARARVCTPIHGPRDYFLLPLRLSSTPHPPPCHPLCRHRCVPAPPTMDFRVGALHRYILNDIAAASTLPLSRNFSKLADLGYSLIPVWIRIFLVARGGRLEHRVFPISVRVALGKRKTAIFPPWRDHLCPPCYLNDRRGGNGAQGRRWSSTGRCTTYSGAVKGRPRVDDSPGARERERERAVGDGEEPGSVPCPITNQRVGGHLTGRK